MCGIIINIISSRYNIVHINLPSVEYAKDSCLNPISPDWEILHITSCGSIDWVSLFYYNKLYLYDIV